MFTSIFKTKYRVRYYKVEKIYVPEYFLLTNWETYCMPYPCEEDSVGFGTIQQAIDFVNQEAGKPVDVEVPTEAEPGFYYRYFLHIFSR